MLLTLLQPGIMPGFPPVGPIVDPETESRAVLQFLEKVDPGERLYLRFLSLYSVPLGEREEFSNFMRLWIRQLTLSNNRRVFPFRLPNSPTLYGLDLRSYQWNDAAWRAVALRDKAFREPYVKSLTARKLRQYLGEKQPSNFHVIGIIDAYALYRRTYQTTETSDYYDLLFANQRYPILKGQFERREIIRHWQGGIWTDGKFYPAGEYTQLESFPQRGFVDFPQTDKEWYGVFTAPLKLDDYDKALVLLKSRRGAVVKGMEDATDNVSFVARNNRIAWLEPALSRIGAVSGRTFDVKKTAGKRDLEENAFTDQPRDSFRKFFDGGELLFTLPAGDGVATLLVNGQGKRVEEVPPDIAIHTRDGRDRRVRNGPMLCYNCHGDAYGWIPLANVIDKDIPNEIDIKFKDPLTGLPDKQAAEDYDAFFRNWQDDLKPIRDTMGRHWREATGTLQRNYTDGYSGPQVSGLSLKWKHRYDDPVTLEQACLETGAPEVFLRVALVKLPLKRAADLARRVPCPRLAWDEELFPAVMGLLASSKEKAFP